MKVRTHTSISFNKQDFYILIVDDHKAMLKIIRDQLGQIGFNKVDEATDGIMALNKMQEQQFDLIISDWNMEPMSGLDLLKQARAIDNYKKTPFIIMTAESKPANLMAAKKAEVGNYIVKPFNVTILEEKLVSVLGEF